MPGPYLTELTTTTIPESQRLAAALTQEYGVKPRHVFHDGFLSGIPADQFDALCADPRVRQVRRFESGQPIPDHYIVRFHDTVTDPQQAAIEITRDHGCDLRHVYQVSIKGFSARIPPEHAPTIRADHRVLRMYNNRLMSFAS